MTVGAARNLNHFGNRPGGVDSPDQPTEFLSQFVEVDVDVKPCKRVHNDIHNIVHCGFESGYIRAYLIVVGRRVDCRQGLIEINFVSDIGKSQPFGAAVFEISGQFGRSGIDVSCQSNAVITAAFSHFVFDGSLNVCGNGASGFDAVNGLEQRTCRLDYVHELFGKGSFFLGGSHGFGTVVIVACIVTRHECENESKKHHREHNLSENTASFHITSKINCKIRHNLRS